MFLKDLLETRESIFRMAYDDPINHPMAIRNVGDLKLGNRIHTDILSLGKYSRNNVFIRKTKYGCECWVRQGYRGYRKAFKRFLQEYYQMIDDIDLYDVDHIVARSIAKRNDLKYLRLTLVKHSNNVSLGAKLEKALARKWENHMVIDLDVFFLFKILEIDFPINSEMFFKDFDYIAKRFSKFFGKNIDYARREILIRFRLDCRGIPNYDYKKVLNFYENYAILNPSLNLY